MILLLVLHTTDTTVYIKQSRSWTLVLLKVILVQHFSGMTYDVQLVVTYITTAVRSLLYALLNINR